MPGSRALDKSHCTYHKTAIHLATSTRCSKEIHTHSMPQRLLTWICVRSAYGISTTYLPTMALRNLVPWVSDHRLRTSERLCPGLDKDDTYAEDDGMSFSLGSPGWLCNARSSWYQHRECNRRNRKHCVLDTYFGIGKKIPGRSQARDYLMLGSVVILVSLGILARANKKEFPRYRHLPSYHYHSSHDETQSHGQT